MAEGTCARHCYVESQSYSVPIPRTSRTPLFPDFRRRLGLLFFTAAASSTRVRSQPGAIQIKVSDELTECVPSNITWTGGRAPYTLGISVGSFSSHGPDQEFSNLSMAFFVWSTDVPAQNYVQFAVGDGLAIAYSGFVDINAGLTQSCLPEPLDPFTSSSGGASPTTNTQGAPTSGSSTGQLPSTSEPVASTTVTVSVSVTGPLGGTNSAAPSTTTGSSTSGSSQSGLSSDVIGIIVAVAVVFLIAVIWILYRWSTRPKPVPASNSSMTASSAAGTVAQYPNPPTSPTVRATSILSASPNYSPIVSPGGALQLAPYGHSPPPAPHPAWQSAASIHTTQTQTYFVGPRSPAPSAPAALPFEPAAGWNTQETYMTQVGGWLGAAPVDQERLSAVHGAGELATSDGGSDTWRALISPPQARRS